jgi:hypothetical protein
MKPQALSRVPTERLAIPMYLYNIYRVPQQVAWSTNPCSNAGKLILKVFTKSMFFVY